MKRTNEITRRAMLRQSAAGIGAMGAMGAGALGLGGVAGAATGPLTPKSPHFEPRAKRIIFLYMTGGVSHVDSFDPKPKLNQMDGKKIPKRPGSKNMGVLVGSPWKPRQWGESGIMSTELFPNMNGVIDDLCLIRSMRVEFSSHVQGTMYMHTGAGAMATPGIGAWISYALGTPNSSLPSHVVLAKREPYGGPQAWDSNFLPAYHQGTRIIPGDDPIPNLKPHAASQPWQDDKLAMLRRINEQHFLERPHQTELGARINSFATARSMQQLAPKLFDLTDESDKTLDMYGLRRGERDSFAWKCIMARRMAEHDVRFIELISHGGGNGQNWDTHKDILRNGPLAETVDRPIAGLIQDLRRRGMLDDTLIVWCTEFGRTPHRDSQGGRAHHTEAFTCWLAGGGVKGGYVYGETDEIGRDVVENTVFVHDFHATILHILGIDHEKLTYHFAGRDRRLTFGPGFTTQGNTTSNKTIVAASGHVIHDLLA